MKSITDRQKEILKFIQDFMAENKYAPSIREIGAACNIESTHGVTCHLQAIEKR
jgi:repressor LexA